MSTGLVIRGALLGLSSLLLGCGSDGSSEPRKDESVEDEPVDGEPMAAEPDPSELRIELPPYQLDPGEEQNYFCYTMTLPADRETVVTEVRPIYGKATHHLGVYQTLAPEPDGQFDCPDLFKMTWLPIYGGGVESGTLTTPTNTGFKLPGGTQLLVQLHLLNASDQALEDKATIVLKTDDSPDLKGAGVFGFDNRTIHVPAGTMNVEQTMSCTAKHDMDAFAVFGHMHLYGTSIEISRGANVGDEILYEAPWTFNDQPTAPLNVHISATDTFHIRCRYDNTSAADLDYGESTLNEMCTVLLYYTPFDGLDGCLKVPE
jgi:hypothetical protein